MSRTLSGRPAGAWAVAAITGLLAAVVVAAPLPRGTPIATITTPVGAAEREGEPGRWRSLDEDGRLRTGDRIRTEAASLARIEFPWTVLSFGPSSVLFVPSASVLGVELESGRLDQRSQGADIIKIRVGSVLVRGRGRVVVRRTDSAAAIMAHSGAFRVLAYGKLIPLAAGDAVVCRPPDRATVVKMPEPPTGLLPVQDPVYVKRGEAAQLAWTASPGARSLIEVSVVGTDEVVTVVEAPASPHPVVLPWLGTYRWRVATLGPDGVEGQLSDGGLLCVVDE